MTTRTPEQIAAISLWQPWASLWCATTAKVHETRHWPIKHRGWIVVHAAKRIEFDHSARLNDILDSEFGGHWGMDLERGAIVGAVHLIDCIPTELAAPDEDDRECGNYGTGRYAWKRDQFISLERPIPYRGQQGLFRVPMNIFPPAIAAAIRAKEPT